MHATEVKMTVSNKKILFWQVSDLTFIRQHLKAVWILLSPITSGWVGNSKNLIKAVSQKF